MEMGVVDKVNYLKLSGLTDGQEVLNMLKEDEVYEIYRSGLYIGMSLDVLFVIYVVILNNIKLNREGITESGVLLNHNNKFMYTYKATNKVNVLDYGINTYHQFIEYIMRYSVKEHKSASCEYRVKSEVFKGSQYDNNGLIGKHSDVIMTLLAMYRHYNGYDSTDKVDEDTFRLMFTTVLDEFNQMDSGDYVMSYNTAIKVGKIRNLIAGGDWKLEKVGGVSESETIRYGCFTERDKEVLNIEFTGVWEDFFDGLVGNMETGIGCKK